VGEDRHVEVRDRHQRESADQVSAPIFEEQAVARQDEEEDRHVVAEAVFAGEDVKKLSLHQSAAFLALALAEFARLPEDLFVRDRPGNARDRQGQQQQPNDLDTEAHYNA